MNVHFVSFEKVITKYKEVLEKHEVKESSWFGKKVFLGYSDKTGWIVHELGLFGKLFRKLNLAYRDTHRQFVMTKLEDLTEEEARLIPGSKLDKAMPKLKAKLQEIYNNKVVNKPKPKKVESPPVTAPLYLSNFNASRCYMDSVLEIMLSQDSIRKQIFAKHEHLDQEIKHLDQEIRAANDENVKMKQEKEKAKKVKHRQILGKIKDLILIAHETKGKGRGDQSPLGEFSPGEKIRQAIFTSGLHPDLQLRNKKGELKIYTTQDASAVLLLLNDILGNSFETVEKDTAIGVNVSAERPAALNYKLEIRFKEDVKLNASIESFIDQLFPLLSTGSSDVRNNLIDQLLPLLRTKNDSKNNDLINQLGELKKNSKISPNERNDLVNQLTDLRKSLEVKLNEMLDRFFTPQQAIDTRNFTVEGQQVKLPYTTQPHLKSLPDSLALHVSRYKFDLQTGSGKVTEPVTLPADGIVDFTPYYSRNNETYKYEITGYAVHHGQQLGGGHYTANIKIGNKFYQCDDMNPNFHTEITAEEFYGNKNAYLVMLKRIPNAAAVG